MLICFGKRKDISKRF